MYYSTVKIFFARIGVSIPSDVPRGRQVIDCLKLESAKFKMLIMLKQYIRDETFTRDIFNRAITLAISELKSDDNL